MSTDDICTEGELPEKEDKGCKSTLVSCNITILGRRTSVRLEPAMWNALHEIARREKCRVHDICSLVHLRKNQKTSLTAAIRVFLMLYYRAAATEDGHVRAGHGNFRSMMARARMPSDTASGLTALQTQGAAGGQALRNGGNGQGERPGVKSSPQPSLSVPYHRNGRAEPESAGSSTGF